MAASKKGITAIKKGSTPSLCAIRVGQGDAFFMKKGDRSLLIDGGRSVLGFPQQFQIAVRRNHVNVLTCTHNDSDHANGSEVERFFRDVVDNVVQNAGYERFEMGKEASGEPFLNVEVFKVIYSSSLVIADLTGMRQDCLTELGYALGLGKKVIITAQEGTRLPFDSAALPCHFWSCPQADTQRITCLQEFMKKNINRKPIVESM